MAALGEDRLYFKVVASQFVFLAENDNLPSAFINNILARLHQRQDEIDQIKREYSGREQWINLQSGLEGVRVTFKSLYDKKDDIIVLSVDKQNEYIHNYFQVLLKSNPVKTCKDMFKLYEFNKDELENYVNIGSTYYAFIVFGCPGIENEDGQKLSNSDVDVIVYVPNEYITNNTIKDLSQLEKKRLNEEIASLSYSSIKIDYCLISITDNGDILATSKGGTETPRIVMHTHDLHRQKYIYGKDVPYFNILPVLKIDKIKAIAKFLLDYIEFFSYDYQSIHDQKIEAYKQEQIIEFSISDVVKSQLDFNGEFIDDLTYVNYTEGYKARHLSNMKTLCMKFIQLLLLERDMFEYTKTGLSQKSILFKDQIGYHGANNDIIQETLYFLSRRRIGKISSYRNVIYLLYDEYCRIVRDFLN